MKKVKTFLKDNFIIYIVFAVILTLDLVTKFLLTNKTIILIDGVLSFKYSENTGAAFSIFENQVLMLIIFTIVFLIALIAFARFMKHKKHWLFNVSYGLVLGGAIGNLIDRIAFGYVRDFVSLDFMNFAIFNLADSALCVGVVLLCIYLLFIDDFGKEKKEKNIN